VTTHDIDSLSPHLAVNLAASAKWGHLAPAFGDCSLTDIRFKAPLASRMSMLRLKESGLKEKAESAVEVVSIACAHILAVAALVVIAGLVIYAR
jgi:hypothetical protein